MTRLASKLSRQSALLNSAAICIAMIPGLSGCGAAMPRASSSPQAPAAGHPAPDSPAVEATSAVPGGSDAEAGAAEPIALSFTKPLEGVTTVQQALDKVKAALADQGFGIITEIDVQTVMNKKLGVEMRPFWILGACNPKKAHQVIEADPQMGLLLPCKVIVYQDSEGTFIVALARPKAIFGLMDRPDLGALADDVEASMRRAFDAL
jgi:uncharacterized protein (DUF302 family)